MVPETCRASIRLRSTSDPLPVVPKLPGDLYPFFQRRDWNFVHRRKKGIAALRDDVHVEVRDRLKGRDAVVLLDQDSIRVER